MKIKKEKPKPKKLFQAWIAPELFDKANEKRRKLKLKKTELVEFLLKEFLKG